MTIKRDKDARDHDVFIRKKLTDPEFAREYLVAILEERQEDSTDVYLASLVHALEQIVYAQGGPRKFIAKHGLSLHHSTLYKLFTFEASNSSERRKGGPEFTTVWEVVRALGVKLAG